MNAYYNWLPLCIGSTSVIELWIKNIGWGLGGESVPNMCRLLLSCYHFLNNTIKQLFYSIYIISDIMCNLELIQTTQEVIHMLYAHTMLFYIRDLNTHRFGYPMRFWNYSLRGTIDYLCIAYQNHTHLSPSSYRHRWPYKFDYTPKFAT